jgi:hypothetical protein
MKPAEYLGMDVHQATMPAAGIPIDIGPRAGQRQESRTKGSAGRSTSLWLCRLTANLFTGGSCRTVGLIDENGSLELNRTGLDDGGNYHIRI